MGSPTAAFSFLVETLVQLVLTVVLLRVLLEAVRADWYNPVCQGVIRLTEPMIKPLKSIFPRMGRVNVAGLVLLYLLQLLGLFVLALIVGVSPDPLALALYALLRLVRLLLVVYLVLIIATVIISWIGQGMRHPIIPLLFQLTDPVLAPIRRVLPPLGGFDLSPLVALIGIQFLIILLGV
ncbi:YggT family protein [Wenzhouxiangella marina]|uniref:Membrane protein n=1 Tax=Wenzhouxiangella marina TaxID=1579979 RepID=A0A0K0XZK6_9GAMM|nr:YggT family protein [Wenzhouxiangella marina]AKS43072.1 membrane protein [Wenzhouxiangella marina]MBB6087244.1 YggT family protein [Wenzhouxiangella marina]